MRVMQMKVGPMQNFAYLLAAREGGREREDRACILVDPGFEGPRLVAEAEAAGLRITDILVTHGHHDHIGAVAAVKEACGAQRADRGASASSAAASGARVWAHESADHPFDEKLHDGQRVRIAGLGIEVLHTPGHRFDSACFVVEGHILTGDTLFVGDCGRVDLPGSDVRAMHRSLLVTLAKLPGELVVLPGHDYGRTPTSTLARERAENPCLRPRTPEEFERFMREP